MCDAFIKSAYDGVAELRARLLAIEEPLITLGLLPERVDRLERLVLLVESLAQAGVRTPTPEPAPEPEPEPTPEPEPEPAPAIPAPIIEVAPIRRHPLAGTVSVLGGNRNG